MLVRDDLTLWSIADASDGGAPPSAADDALAEIARWSQDFLVPGHPELGRTGPVCPYSKPSMDRSLFFLAKVEAGDGESTAKQVLRYRDWHAELSAELSDKDRPYLTIVIVLPGFDRDDPAELNALQARLQGDFVAQGLMIGQFHPHCDEPGLWNSDFRPLRAPLPVLGMRTMVPFDLPFLAGNRDNVDAYLAEFAPAIPARVRSQLSELVARP
ncbi:DUF6875 domain-containing protein [Amycolatopsis sp. NPDC059090]|uniref:DUF6875 domain-containing protein n=1 Tax=unclassified Amycolatopsis TaxID=2618356 RepID=UPI00366C1575